jgi:putative NADPH-quinone reductase
MPRHIAIIQGHPDPNESHFCHALAEAYDQGAKAGGHEVELIKIAQLDFPLLRTKADFEGGQVPATLQEAQDAIGRSDHLVLLYPLWLGTMPALLKGFLEQVLRPGFAFDMGSLANGGWTCRLKGKSARIVVTMGMPALVYRWFFGAHSLKNLERSILGFCGIKPIRESLFGMVETASPEKHQKWLAKMKELGRAGA